jgi:hypothetical protein
MVLQSSEFFPFRLMEGIRLEPITLIVLIAFAGPIIGSVIGTLRRPSFNFVCSMLCFTASVILEIALRIF